MRPQQSPKLEALQKQSRVADLRNLGAVSTPAQNTRSKTAGKWPTGKGCCKVRTIEQELVLACIETYTEVTYNSIEASSLTQRTFPIKMLNPVLNKDTGVLMEIQQLLRSPKYSDLRGNCTPKAHRPFYQSQPIHRSYWQGMRRGSRQPGTSSISSSQV